MGRVIRGVNNVDRRCGIRNGYSCEVDVWGYRGGDACGLWWFMERMWIVEKRGWIENNSVSE